MILKTARLTLRPQEMDDAPSLFAILGDPEAMRFWNRPAIARLGTVEELVREQQAAMESGLCRYWTLLEDFEPIGSVDLSLIENSSAELGFLLRRNRWGNGFGTEAVRCVIAQGCGPLGVMRLAAAVRCGNVAAVRVLEKSGFAKLETRQNVRLAGGTLADCSFYGLRRG